MRRAQAFADQDYGFEITAVEDADGDDLPYTINGTMMRIDLPAKLDPEQQVAFSIDFEFNIIDEPAVGGRGGYEHFPKNDKKNF